MFLGSVSFNFHGGCFPRNKSKDLTGIGLSLAVIQVNNWGMRRREANCKRGEEATHLSIKSKVPNANYWIKPIFISSQCISYESTTLDEHAV